MNTTEKQKIKAICTLATIKKFIPEHQYRTLADMIKHSEESEYFRAKVSELAKTIETMHETYQQDGKGKYAIAHLHYFYGSFDAWITEKDMDGGTLQAFGYADLGGYGAECGYICIDEYTKSPRVEIDLHFTPRLIGEILKDR